MLTVDELKAIALWLLRGALALVVWWSAVAIWVGRRGR